MIFAVLEDSTGEIEIIVFTKMFVDYNPMIMPEEVLAVYGDISVRDDEAPKILVKRIAPMRPNKSYTHRPSPFADLVSEKRLAQNKYYADKMKQTPPAPSPAPAKAASNVPAQKAKNGKLYLRVSSLESKEARRAMAIVSIFQIEDQFGGVNTPVIFYDSTSGKYLSRADMKTDASDFVIAQLSALLGKDNVILK